MVMGQLVDEIITLLALGDQLLHHLTGASHHELVGSALGLVLETGPTPVGRIALSVVGGESHASSEGMTAHAEDV